MLSKARVLVLGAVKYGDNSLILRTYSRESGLISFIAGGSRSKKGPLKMVMSQPLSQLDVVYYESSKSDLKRIREVNLSTSYTTLLFDPLKSCITLFLAEILKNILKEEESNPGLFDFLCEAMLLMDKLQEGLANFHLVFLYKLLQYGGFQPEGPGRQLYFDLRSGTYEDVEPPHYHYLNDTETEQWKKLAVQEFSELNIYRPGTQNRKMLLQKLLLYYRLHYNDFGELKSLEVLQSVLR